MFDPALGWGRGGGVGVIGKAELMTPPLLTADELAYQDGSTYPCVGYVRRVIIDPGFRKLGLARVLMLHVIVSPGGSGAGMVALDKMTGKTIWVTKELTTRRATRRLSWPTWCGCRCLR